MSDPEHIRDVIFTVMEEIDEMERQQQVRLCELLGHDPIPQSIGRKVLWRCRLCGAEV